MISEAAYIETLDQLAPLAGLIAQLPLQAAQDYNERAQALGPILNPTAYNNGGAGNLRAQRQLIDACVALQQAVRQVTTVPG